jgi:hypothetical protein
MRLTVFVHNSTNMTKELETAVLLHGWYMYIYFVRERKVSNVVKFGKLKTRGKLGCS